MLRRMSTYVVPLVLLTGAMGGAAVAEAPASALADLRARFCSPEPPRSIGPLYWYHGEDEYPTVGIPDSRFPLETSATPGALVGGFVRQTAYPFRQCIEDIGRYRRR